MLRKVIKLRYIYKVFGIRKVKEVYASNDYRRYIITILRGSVGNQARTWKEHYICVHSYLAYPSSPYWYIIFILFNIQYYLMMSACSICMQNICVTSGSHAKFLHKYKRRLESLVNIDRVLSGA